MTAVRSRPRTEAAWVDIGVDDLTKYRIVEYLYQQRPGNEAEVSVLAADLGFHSLDQTLSALEDLSRRGVVCLEPASGAPERCGPSPDPAMRARVAELLALDRDPEEAASLLGRLAGRSLDRALARLKRSRRQAGTGAPAGLAAPQARPQMPPRSATAATTPTTAQYAANG